MAEDSIQESFVYKWLAGLLTALPAQIPTRNSVRNLYGLCGCSLSSCQDRDVYRSVCRQSQRLLTANLPERE